jgi:adenosylmethionine-8-amino-7-oxononanoate aminotransferase
MAAVEVVADKTTRQLYPSEAGLTQRLVTALMERGLWTRVVMDCICLAPPLTIEDELIDRTVSIIEDAIPSVLSNI